MDRKITDSNHVLRTSILTFPEYLGKIYFKCGVYNVVSVFFIFFYCKMAAFYINNQTEKLTQSS